MYVLDTSNFVASACLVSFHFFCLLFQSFSPFSVLILLLSYIVDCSVSLSFFLLFGKQCHLNGLNFQLLGHCLLQDVATQQLCLRKGCLSMVEEVQPRVIFSQQLYFLNDISVNYESYWYIFIDVTSFLHCKKYNYPFGFSRSFVISYYVS